MNIEEMIEEMAKPPVPAREVVTLDRALVEKILADAEEREPLSSLVVDLRAILAEPKVELWVMHSPGPGEFHPAPDRETAERWAQETIDACEKTISATCTHQWKVVVNVVPSPYEPAEHFEVLANDMMEHNESLLEYVKELEAEKAQWVLVVPQADPQREDQPVVVSGTITYNEMPPEQKDGDK